jgi:molybdenum cofactor cytidylyltransferase
MFSAIVLAAGESTRMGAKNKLLLPFGSEPLIAHVVRRIQASRVAEVIVVLGHQAEQVRQALEGLPVRFVTNDRFAEGMTTSIHAGIGAASDRSQGFMICLSDLPLIQTGEYDLLLEAFEQALKQDNHSILVPVYKGQRGNPVLFSVHYRQDILRHEGLMGCQGIVKQNRDRVIEVEMPSDHILKDMDTPEVYAQMKLQQQSS